MTRVELEEVREKLAPYLQEAMAKHQISMVFVMLTNIMEETTYLQCDGEGVEELMATAYGVDAVPGISEGGEKSAGAGQADKGAADGAGQADRGVADGAGQADTGTASEYS